MTSLTSFASNSSLLLPLLVLLTSLVTVALGRGLQVPSWTFPNSTFPAQPVPSQGHLCVLLYSRPGPIDFSWSVSIALSFLYLPIRTSAVSVRSGSGRRTYTNRFGDTFTTNLTVLPALRAGDNPLYLHSPSSPFDSTGGITLLLNSSLQMPGLNPYESWEAITLHTVQGLVMENDFPGADPSGTAYLSSVTGFANQSIATSNVNALVANETACKAPITSVNGLVAPTQPSVKNSAVQFLYSYSISNASSYRVVTQLLVTCTSHFANHTDRLGNPYQVVANITGTRLYTQLLRNGSVNATLLSNVSFYPSSGSEGRFYPYTFIAVPPGVYSTDTVPHWDSVGLTMRLSPAVPANGLPPGNGTQFSTQSVRVEMMRAHALITESHSITTPDYTLQRQDYTLITT